MNKNKRGSPDELHDNLALPVTNMHTGVITWWRTHGNVFPSLNELARQYLGCLATSTGVERFFSAAGLTSCELAKAMEEETLLSEVDGRI